jgi:hypothetical protein
MAIIDKPSDYFNTKLYTGTGSSLANTGVGFQPDLTWIKGRSGATEHVLTDSVRGVTKELSSNDTGAEETVAQGLTAFGSDGFTVGTDGSYNTSSATYASWNFKAGTSFTNDASATGIGDIDSSGSANTTSGFSIVKWSGTSATGTIGHGLGSVPKTVWVKSLANAEGIYTYWQPLGNDKQLLMSSNSAQGTTTLWNSTTPTSSVFSVINHSAVNGSGDYIAYCFAEKQGYSKFGSYTGNNNANGPFVYTGFKPAFIMMKSTSTGGDNAYSWSMFDNKRSSYNIKRAMLKANLSDAEYTSGSNADVDILSNGFKMRSSPNETNGANTYIYMAFAEQPFVTSTGVPATAR